jgi:hypothetical protein
LFACITSEYFILLGRFFDEKLATCPVIAYGSALSDMYT